MPGARKAVGEGAGVAAPSFFVQSHRTQRVHWDLYLEVEGRLLTWVLPKPPVADPHVRRFAIRGPDRDLEYGHFEGVIPLGEPGAGVVMVWDYGTYRPYPPVGLTTAQWLERGLLKLHFSGERLRGLWELVRWRSARAAPETWLLAKLRDRHALPGATGEEEARSVLTGRSFGEIGAEAARGPPTAGPPLLLTARLP